MPGYEHEVETVRWLFNEFFHRDVSFHQLAVELNKRDIPSPKGGKWVYMVVHDLLTNPRFAGRMSIGQNLAGKFFRLTGGQVRLSKEKNLDTALARLRLSSRTRTSRLSIRRCSMPFN